MDLVPLRMPRRALLQATELLIPPGISSVRSLELDILIDDEDLSVRDFGAHLSLLYRVYGRLTQSGLRSYAQRPTNHLQVRLGSIELVIRQVMSYLDNGMNLVALSLFASFFASAAKSTSEILKNAAEAHKAYEEGEQVAETRELSSEKIRSEITKNYADAYKSFEEGRLVRENRRRIREGMKSDPVLHKLDPQRIAELARLIEELNYQERENIAAPRRFAHKKVRKIEIRVSDAEDVESPDKIESNISKSRIHP